MTDHAHQSRPPDPRGAEVHGDEGMPAELIDTDQNLPGDQPEGDAARGPDKSTLEGKDDTS